MTKLGVVILHGFNSTPLYMKGIEYELKKWGRLDQVLNLSLYGSKWGIFPNKYNLSTPIIKIENGNVDLKDTLAEHVLAQLKDEVDPNLDAIILLGHSMGGLVWRTIYKSVLSDKKENWLGKNSPRVSAIIQLATPNQGSELTNMELIKLFDKLQTSIILKFSGFSINLINKLLQKIGLNEGTKGLREIDLISETTQIKQMRPNSKFLNWLNGDPTFVEEIPHYRLIGTKNGVILTNYAWITNAKDLNYEDLVQELQEDLVDEDFNRILNSIEFSDGLDDVELKELKKYLNDEDSEDIEIDSTTNLIDQIILLFNEDNFIPNDGLVSVEDAKLPGSILLDLEPYSSKISHHSICMWFLPFKPYRRVRDLVIETIEQFLE